MGSIDSLFPVQKTEKTEKELTFLYIFLHEPIPDKCNSGTDLSAFLITLYFNYDNHGTK
jgi:hypothetical protein